MSKYGKYEVLSINDEEDYMAALEIIFCEHHQRPEHQRKPDLVLPHVYVGNIGNAENYRLLRNCGITHVLNCAGYRGLRSYEGSPYEGLDIDYKEFRADDSESYDMSQHFHDAFMYMDKVKRKNGSVLVHCSQGINRSVAVCLAYTMLQKNYTLLKAAKHMQKKRGCVLSNRAFQRQLVQFAKENGCLDSRKELEKILPKQDHEEPKMVPNGMIPKMEPNGMIPEDIYTYQSCSYPTKVIDKIDLEDLLSDKHDDTMLNGSTCATGTSIFEDYLRRMKSH